MSENEQPLSENEQPSVGQVLREAREARGINVDEIAARLRLMQRQIEAMESDNFESLGQPVFARGFVRNYARLLGLEADELLARMEGAPVEPVATVRHPEPPLPRSWLGSPWLILLLFGLLIAVVAPVALYWWLNEGEDELVGQVASSVQIEPVPLAVRAPAAAPAEQPAPVEAPAPAEPAAAGSSDVPAAAASGAASGAAEGGAPAAPASATPATPAPASKAPASQTPASQAPASQAPGSVVHLEFGGDAWVEIKDASGRMLHRQLNLAGSSVDVKGRPPFDLVIGNAAQARLAYNGRPIDLKPFIGLTVARFTLEE